VPGQFSSIRQKPGQPLGVFEDIEATPRRHLFTVLGIPVYATRIAWLHPVTLLPGILVLTWIFYPNLTLGERVGLMIQWILLTLLLGAIHSLGHIISSKLASAPMSYLLVTATRQVTIYEGDQSQFPPRTHIIRAIGGPIANIAAGIIGLLLTASIGPTPALLYFVIVNLLAVLAFLPISTVDGEVIWKYLRVQH
jgi:hypothetical protein